MVNFVGRDYVSILMMIRMGILRHRNLDDDGNDC